MGRGNGSEAMPDEFTLIDELLAPLAGPEGLGLKDDAAVLSPRAGHDLVFTKDTIAEGRHYLPDDPPETVAKKLLRVNLSDLAAKGATPLGYLLSTAWSSETSFEWMKQFVAGLREDQSEFGLHLWGGDTIKTSGPSVFSLTGIGEVPTGQMVTRSGAQVGDELWVTGTIGDAALGLKAAQGQLRALSDGDRDILIEGYRVPEPPVAFGSKLPEIASAAIDVSDGLLADLAHLCEQSSVGACIEKRNIPLSEVVNKCLEIDNQQWQLVSGGGDDYQILFTAPVEKKEQVLELAGGEGVRVSRLGVIAKETGVVLLDEAGQPIDAVPAGFTHFK